jgi:hypothetical protein
MSGNVSRKNTLLALIIHSHAIRPVSLAVTAFEQVPNGWFASSNPIDTRRLQEDNSSGEIGSG